MIQTLLGVRRMNPELKPAIVDDTSVESGETQLNATPTQTLAVNCALTRHLTLIQGPPGCGKTRVIAATCLAML
jgi:MoxR-like ATPase